MSCSSKPFSLAGSKEESIEAAERIGHSSSTVGSSRSLRTAGHDLPSNGTGCDYGRTKRSEHTPGTKPASCVQCHRSKSRCDKVEPSCGNCTRKHEFYSKRQSRARKDGSEEVESGAEEVDDMQPAVNKSATSSAHSYLVTEEDNKANQGMKDKGEDGEGREKAKGGTQAPSTAGEQNDTEEDGSANDRHGKLFVYEDENNVTHPFRWTCRR